jgi:hypothetical protein
MRSRFTGRRARESSTAREPESRESRSKGTQPPPASSEDFGGVSPDDPPIRPPRLSEPPERERVRSRLAVCFVLLLAAVVLTLLASAIIGVNRSEVESVSNIVLPPVVALCGTIIGFYYASSR